MMKMNGLVGIDVSAYLAGRSVDGGAMRGLMNICEGVKIAMPKEMTEASSFDKWLDTFIDEKGIDPEEDFEVASPNGTSNHMTYQNVIDGIKSTGSGEQQRIKTMIVKLDFKNADVKDYLRHLAKALAQDLPESQKVSESEELWKMTKAEYEKKFGVDKKFKRATVTGGFSPHKSAVEIALNQGKQVPDEVLADYPDLKDDSGRSDHEWRRKESAPSAGAALVSQAKKLLAKEKSVYIMTNDGKRYRVIKTDSSGVMTIAGDRIPSEDVASVDTGMPKRESVDEAADKSGEKFSDIPFKEFAAKDSEFTKTAREINKDGLMNMYVKEAINKQSSYKALVKEIRLAIKMHGKYDRQPGSSPLHSAVTAAMWRLLSALYMSHPEGKSALAAQGKSVGEAEQDGARVRWEVSDSTGRAIGVTRAASEEEAIKIVRRTRPSLKDEKMTAAQVDNPLDKREK